MQQAELEDVLLMQHREALLPADFQPRESDVTSLLRHVVPSI